MSSAGNAKQALSAAYDILWRSHWSNDEDAAGEALKAFTDVFSNVQDGFLAGGVQKVTTLAKNARNWVTGANEPSRFEYMAWTCTTLALFDSAASSKVIRPEDPAADLRSVAVLRGVWRAWFEASRSEQDACTRIDFAMTFLAHVDGTEDSLLAGLSTARSEVAQKQILWTKRWLHYISDQAAPPRLTGTATRPTLKTLGAATPAVIAALRLTLEDWGRANRPVSVSRDAFLRRLWPADDDAARDPTDDELVNTVPDDRPTDPLPTAVESPPAPDQLLAPRLVLTDAVFPSTDAHNAEVRPGGAGHCDPVVVVQAIDTIEPATVDADHADAEPSSLDASSHIQPGSLVLSLEGAEDGGGGARDTGELEQDERVDDLTDVHLGAQSPDEAGPPESPEDEALNATTSLERTRKSGRSVRPLEVVGAIVVVGMLVVMGILVTRGLDQRQPTRGAASAAAPTSTSTTTDIAGPTSVSVPVNTTPGLTPVPDGADTADRGDSGSATGTGSSPTTSASQSGGGESASVSVAAVLDQADQLIDTGEKDVAIALLQTIEGSGEANATAIALTEARALDSGDNADPRAAYDRLMKVVEEGDPSPGLMAQAQRYRYEYAKDLAGPQIIDLAKANPDDPVVQVVYAYLLTDQAQWKDEVDVAAHAQQLVSKLDKSQQRDRQLAVVLYYRAYAYEQLGRVTEALQPLRDAYALRGTSGSYYAGELVSALQRVGTPDALDEALEVLDQLVLLPTQKMFALRRRGDLLVDQGDPSDGAAAIREAIAMENADTDPYQAAANHQSLAHALTAAHEPLADVEAELETAHQLDPNLSGPLVARANAIYDADPSRLQEALDLVKSATQSPTAGWYEYYQLCWWQNTYGSNDDAANSCATAVAKGPQQIDAWLQKGWVAYARNDWPGMRDDFLQAQQLNPANQMAAKELCWVYSWQLADATDSAVKTCTASFNVDASEFTQRNLGRAYRLAGQPALAETALNNAVHEDSTDPWGWLELARLHRDNPDIDPQTTLTEFDNASSVADGADDYAAYARSIGDPGAADAYRSAISTHGDTAARHVGLAAVLSTSDRGAAVEEYHQALLRDSNAARDEGERIGLDPSIVAEALLATRPTDPDPEWDYRYARAHRGTNSICDATSLQLLQEALSLDTSSAHRSRANDVAECLTYTTTLTRADGRSEVGPSPESLEAIKTLAENEMTTDPALGRFLRGYWYYDSVAVFSDDPTARTPNHNLAVDDLKAAIAADPTYYPAYDRLAQLYAYRGVGTVEELTDIWAQIRKQFGTWSGSLATQAQQMQSLATDLAARGAPANELASLKVQITDILERATTTDQWDPYAFVTLGHQLITDDPVNAERLLRRATGLHTTNPQVFVDLRDLVTDPKDRVTFAIAAATLDNKNVDNWARAGWLAYDAGDWQRSEFSFLKVNELRAQPEDTRGEFGLAFLYTFGFEHSRQSEVLDHLKPAVEHPDGETGWWNLLSIAQGLAEQIDSDDDARAVATVVGLIDPSDIPTADPDPSTQSIPATQPDLTTTTPPPGIDPNSLPGDVVFSGLPVVLDTPDSPAVQYDQKVADVVRVTMQRWPNTVGYEAALTILDSAHR